MIRAIRRWHVRVDVSPGRGPHFPRDYWAGIARERPRYPLRAFARSRPRRDQPNGPAPPQSASCLIQGVAVSQVKRLAFSPKSGKSRKGAGIRFPAAHPRLEIIAYHASRDSEEPLIKAGHDLPESTFVSLPRQCDKLGFGNGVIRDGRLGVGARHGLPSDHWMPHPEVPALVSEHFQAGSRREPYREPFILGSHPMPE